MDQREYPLFKKKPQSEAALWRYLSFASFVFLLDREQLHFRRVDHFDDHFEGVWPKHDADLLTNDPMFRPFRLPNFTEEMRCQVAASCWTELPHESAAMWRLYAPGNESVAVVTSFSKLSSLVRASRKDNWLADAACVRYINHLTESLIDLKNGEHFHALTPLMCKNISYEHEKEVRALICAPPPCQIPKEGFDLQLGVIADFVNEIVLNPFCQGWFEKAVTAVANRYGLKCRIRKSSLSPDLFYMKQN